ncbi:MAG: right-handed parallel beta-helix repeat-containing protein [Candidatus Eisenbacteria bacterium]
MLICRLAAIVTGLLLVTCVLHAAVIEVPGDHPTIQEGVNAAAEGDTVLVDHGTYAGPLNRSISFLGINRCLVSKDGADSTIIDCEQADRAFLFGTGETEASIVDGFTVVNGGGRPFNGGAIYIYGASPTIRNCVFRQNTAADAGAVLCLYSSSTISDCTFVDNSANSQFGGALACSYSSPVVTGCTFSGNAAPAGSAIRMYDSSGSINDCTIVGNSTTEYGVIRFDISSTTAITNTIVAFNTHGIPIHCAGGSVPTTTHCVVFGNAEGDSLSGSYHDNLFVDPLLCDMYGGNFSLCADSPCLPGSLGNPWGELVGACDQGCAECGSAVEQTTWGVMKGMYR